MSGIGSAFARGDLAFFFLLLLILSSSIDCSQRAVITLLCLCFNSDGPLLNCYTIDLLEPPDNSAVATSVKRPCHDTLRQLHHCGWYSWTNSPLSK